MPGMNHVIKISWFEIWLWASCKQSRAVNQFHMSGKDSFRFEISGPRCFSSSVRSHQRDSVSPSHRPAAVRIERRKIDIPCSM